METYADVRGKFRVLRHQTLCRAHDEFEMGDVVALLVPDHQKFVLIGRPPMQTISTIKHEYLESGDTVVERERFHLIDMRCLDRCHVITIVDPESSLGLLENFGHEVTVWSPTV